MNNLLLSSLDAKENPKEVLRAVADLLVDRYCKDGEYKPEQVRDWYDNHFDLIEEHADDTPADEDWEIKTVHAVGGGEGQGDDVERVLQITYHGVTRFIKFTGFYASYEGTEFDEDSPKFVEPYKVTVTRYK